MNRILLTEYEERLFFGLWEEEKPAEIAFYDKEPGLRLGDICLARVQDIVPGIRAAFVWLTPEQKAYLPLEQAPAGLRCGDELPVQLVKEAQKTKAPVVTGRLSLTGRLAVLVTDGCQIHISSKIHDDAWKEEALRRLKELHTQPDERPYGLIVRTGAYQASLDELCKESQALAAQYKSICQTAATRAVYSRLAHSDPGWLTRLYGVSGRLTDRCEIITDQPRIQEACQAFLEAHDMESLFSLRLYTDMSYPLRKLYRLDTVLQDALSKYVWLKSGGYLVIEPTEAMVVIDVNTGKAESRRTKEETILRLNLEAAVEIARQMRLRNLSGMILIDFIDMKKEAHQAQLLHALREAVQNDPAGVSVVDMTKLGIVECTRRKTSRPLYEQIQTDAKNIRRKFI